jgi:peptide deformylase
MSSIYKRLANRFPAPRALPILTHGSKDAKGLHERTERIVNPRIQRVKNAIQTLKLSAAVGGSYSLSAN